MHPSVRMVAIDSNLVTTGLDLKSVRHSNRPALGTLECRAIFLVTVRSATPEGRQAGIIQRTDEYVRVVASAVAFQGRISFKQKLGYDLADDFSGDGFSQDVVEGQLTVERVDLFFRKTDMIANVPPKATKFDGKSNGIVDAINSTSSAYVGETGELCACGNTRSRTTWPE